MDVLTELIVVFILQYIYIYQTIALYTLNLQSVVCQLYLNKAGIIKD